MTDLLLLYITPIVMVVGAPEQFITRRTSFAEDLRPGFIGHIVMTFHWDPPNDRQLQKIYNYDLMLTLCVFIVLNSSGDFGRI